MVVYLRKASKRWAYNFMVGGKRHSRLCVDPDTREPARNRTEAERLEDLARAVAIRRLRAGAAGNAAAAAAPGATVYTLAQAVAAYSVRAQQMRDWRKISGRMDELLNHFGHATPVTAIGTAQVEAYQAWALTQPVRRWRGGPSSIEQLKQKPHGAKRATFRAMAHRRTGQTVNRYLSTLSAILRGAHRLRDVHGRRLLPELPDMPWLPEAPAAARPLGDELLGKVLRAAAEHVRHAVALAALAGTRLQEALRLEIRDYDPRARVLLLPGSRQKSNRPDPINLSPRAAALVEWLIERARAAHQVRLILYAKPLKRPKGLPKDAPQPTRLVPITSLRRAWLTALEAAGAPRHRFHDLRADFADGLALDPQVSVRLAQQIMRHATPTTTQRYLGKYDLARRQAVDRLDQRPALAGVQLLPPPPENTPAESHPKSHPTATRRRRRVAGGKRRKADEIRLRRW